MRQTNRNAPSTNHAEEVRARHKTAQPAKPVRLQSKAQGGPSKTRYNYNASPVIIRNVAPGRPMARNVQSNVRKQVVIPLNTPGAELRLPALSNFRIGWRLVSGILAVFLAFILYTVYNNPTFQLGTATVTGAERLTADEINTALGVEGLPAVEAMPQKMETTLRKTFPDLAKAQVTVSLPAKLKVAVVERQPVLAWEQDGKVTWIDADGIAFPSRGDGSALPLIKADGAPPKPLDPNAPAADTLAGSLTAAAPTAAATKTVKPADAFTEPAPFIDKDLIKALVDLSAQAPKNTPVVYSTQYGMGWKDPHGWQVFFGSSTTDMVSKLATYQGIVDYLTKNNLSPKLISVEFAHAPFYRMEP